LTATAVANNSALTPMGENSAMPAQLSFPLAASSVPLAGKMQFLTADPTTGNATLPDDGTPNQIALGFVFPDELTAFSGTAGKAEARVSQRWMTHASPSTIANDGFTAADIAVPFFLADGNTPGKLSNVSGKNRTVGGLVIGLAQPGETAVRLWGGPIAQLLARAAMLAASSEGGSVAYPVDASASTDIGSVSTTTSALMIPRAKRHGVISSIEIIPSAALSATSGNDRTITVWKVDTLGVASDVSVGTFTTTTALVAHVAGAFTLSAVAGALNMLETDILCYSTVHAGSGAVIPQSALRANMKVI